MSEFDRKEVSKLLADCHRRCCICHQFCGVKMETDHIEQRADTQNHSIENAIPVCFECHAEIHLYNDKHPKGRKFLPEELKEHKRQWLEICKGKPEIFINPLQRSDIGPLQALLDELLFNKDIVANNNSNEIGCPFETKQFDRVLSEGYLSVLHEDLSALLIQTYRKMKKANTALGRFERAQHSRDVSQAENQLIQIISKVDTLEECYQLLKGYLE